MTAREILEALPRLSALVVGDICLDRWSAYDPGLGEPSRETGIPRIGVISTQVTPGAGGTVANNLAALGVGRVAVLGAIGSDGFGHELEGALHARGISSALLVKSAAISTFTYTKLLNTVTGEEDLPRVDFVNTKPLPQELESELLAKLRASQGDFDVILVSDQAETELGGIVTPRVRELLSTLGREHPRKVIWVDSRMRGELFRDVIVKSNEDEADAACRRIGAPGDRQRLAREVRARLLYVTAGARGVSVLEGREVAHVPTDPIEKPVDICGAGDSFSAGAASALAAGASPVEAAGFGNLISSITVMKKGTGTASPAELLARL